MTLKDLGYWKLLVLLGQCDLIIVQGTVTRKMAPRLRMVYDLGKSKDNLSTLEPPMFKSYYDRIERWQPSFVIHSF
jgi:hypothetical protein